MTLHERMAKAFAAISDDDRRFWLGVVEEVARRRNPAAPRPVLRLIQGGPPATVPIPKPRATTCTRTKEST